MIQSEQTWKEELLEFLVKFHLLNLYENRLCYKISFLIQKQTITFYSGLTLFTVYVKSIVLEDIVRFTYYSLSFVGGNAGVIAKSSFQVKF